MKRGTGVLFCFVFCHVTENEETIKKNTADRWKITGSSTKGGGFRSKLIF